MTVSRTDSEQAFTASSSTASYSVAFPVRAADDLVVSLDGALLTGGGSDYSAALLGSPAGSAGATITPVSPWASGTLRVRRETTRLQEVDFQTAQRFDPEVVEQALDHGVMRAQEIDAKQARTIRAAVGESLAELPSAADRANKTLVFDASGNPGAGVALPSELTITGASGPTKIIHSVDGDNAQYAVGLPDGDYGDLSFSGGVATLDAGVVDLDAIAAAVKSGLDADLITGTAGSAGDMAAWNGDGDLVAATPASDAEIDAGTETALRAVSPALIKRAVDQHSRTAPDYHVRDEKASGTDGGSSTTGSWLERDLNTEVRDELSVTLSGNEPTLPAGTYDVYARAPAHNAQAHQIRLYDVTNSAVLLTGAAAYTQSSTGVVTDAVLNGVIALSAATALRLEHRVTAAQTTNGLGVAHGFGGSEIYAELIFRRVA